jgi:hypothetical protein
MSCKGTGREGEFDCVGCDYCETDEENEHGATCDGDCMLWGYGEDFCECSGCTFCEE